jgi:hypothetical protein
MLQKSLYWHSLNLQANAYIGCKFTRCHTAAAGLGHRQFVGFQRSEGGMKCISASGYCFTHRVTVSNTLSEIWANYQKTTAIVIAKVLYLKWIASRLFQVVANYAD